MPKRYCDYVATAAVINDHATRRRSRRRTILKTLKGLKALQQRADSTNNMPAENYYKMTNSDEYMLRMSRTLRILMLVAHKKK